MESPEESVLPTSDEETLEEEVEPSLNGSADSLLDTLRAKRKAIGEDRHIDLEIPGYDGLLVVRYRNLPDAWDLSKKIAQRIERSKNPRAELLGMCDTLIEACDQVFVKRESGLYPAQDAYPDLGGQDPGEPVRFDKRLAQMLGFEAPNARAVVLRTFSNDMALTKQYNDVAVWMQESRTDDDQDF